MVALSTLRHLKNCLSETDIYRVFYRVCIMHTQYFEDILIPLLLQHSLILLVLTLTIVVLVVALLLRPL